MDFTCLQGWNFRLADAYVEAFTLHGVPIDKRAEKDLQTAAQQIAAGTISAIRGDLDLMNTRTRKHQNRPGGHLNREIDAAMKSALKEGALRLKRQRIKAQDPGSPGPSDADPLAGWVPAHRADWREDAASALECPPLLQPVKAARLDAITTLPKEAVSDVQSSLPQTKQALELCLWPAFSQYAETVFDKMAELRLEHRTPRWRPRTYQRWLRSKCLPAVIDDVCLPIAGQYPTTIRLVVETIGERRSPALDVTKRVLWEMVALAIGGPFTENLRKCLVAHLEGRSPHWEAVVAQPHPATVSGEQEAAAATRQRPELPPKPADAQAPVPLSDLLRGAEGRTADPKLRNKLVAVLRYNRYFGI
jgi:hypothetical protein